MKIFFSLRSLLVIALLMLCRNIASAQKYIDLGLPSGTLWAAYNMGSNSCTEYGNLYYWGQVNQNDNVCHTYGVNLNAVWNKPSVPQSDRNRSDFSRYHHSNKETHEILWGDVCKTVYGNKWQMPRQYHWDELIRECNWRWVTINGVSGYFVSRHYNLDIELKGKTTNQCTEYLLTLLEDQAIFFPAAGKKMNTYQNVSTAKSWIYKQGPRIGENINGYYWTADNGTLPKCTSGTCVEFSYDKTLKKNVVKTSTLKRDMAMCVRPILVQRVMRFRMMYATDITIDYSDAMPTNALIVEFEHGIQVETPERLREVKKHIRYKSTNPSVATVDPISGEILKIKSVGSTNIIATFDAENAYTEFERYGTYTSNVAIFTLTVRPTELDMWWDLDGEDVTGEKHFEKIGNNYNLPIAGVDEEELYDEMYFKSSNPEVATVDKLGNVTIIGKGSTEITAIIGADTKKYREKKEISYTLIVYEENSVLYWGENRVIVTWGEKYSMPQLYVRPEYKRKEVRFGSTNSEVAIVQPNGNLLIKSTGITNIVASLDGVKALCQLIVVPTLKWSHTKYLYNLGEKFTPPTLNVTPFRARNDIRYKSTNPNVASIDRLGNIKVHTVGSTDIVAYLSWMPEIMTVYHLDINLSMQWVNNHIEQEEIKKHGVSYKKKGQAPYPVLKLSAPNFKKYIRYISSNPDVASIDEITGTILIKKWGRETKITAYISPELVVQSDGQAISASYTLSTHKAPVSIYWDPAGDYSIPIETTTKESIFKSLSCIKCEKPDSYYYEFSDVRPWLIFEPDKPEYKYSTYEIKADQYSVHLTSYGKRVKQTVKRGIVASISMEDECPYELANKPQTVVIKITPSPSPSTSASKPQPQIKWYCKLDDNKIPCKINPETGCVDVYLDDPKDAAEIFAKVDSEEDIVLKDTITPKSNPKVARTEPKSDGSIKLNPRDVGRTEIKLVALKKGTQVDSNVTTFEVKEKPTMKWLDPTTDKKLKDSITVCLCEDPLNQPCLDIAPDSYSLVTKNNTNHSVAEVSLEQKQLIVKSLGETKIEMEIPLDNAKPVSLSTIFTVVEKPEIKWINPETDNEYTTDPIVVYKEEKEEKQQDLPKVDVVPMQYAERLVAQSSNPQVAYYDVKQKQLVVKAIGTTTITLTITFANGTEVKNISTFRVVPKPLIKWIDPKTQLEIKPENIRSENITFDIPSENTASYDLCLDETADMLPMVKVFPDVYAKYLKCESNTNPEVAYCDLQTNRLVVKSVGSTEITLKVYPEEGDPVDKKIKFNITADPVIEWRDPETYKLYPKDEITGEEEIGVWIKEAPENLPFVRVSPWIYIDGLVCESSDPNILDYDVEKNKLLVKNLGEVDLTLLLTRYDDQTATHASKFRVVESPIVRWLDPQTSDEYSTDPINVYMDENWAKLPMINVEPGKYYDNLEVSSTDPNVVYYDSEKQQLIIKSVGSAKLTATITLANDKKISADININVIPPRSESDSNFPPNTGDIEP